MKNLVIIIMGALSISCGNKPKFQFHDNMVVAHQGAWKANSLPENSIAS